MNTRISPDQCIACTTCLVHCPVAEATPHFLGPRMIGPAYERFRRMGLEEDPSLHYCANCKNCDISCPQGVPVASINMLARLAQCEKKRPGLRDWVLAHGELLAKLLRTVPAVLKNLGMDNPITRSILDGIGIARKARLPHFAKASFRAQLKAYKQPDLPKKLVFFPGCYIEVYDPETGMDLVWLLNRAGYQVIAPDELSCCGLPLIANGFGKEARTHAEQNLKTLKQYRDQGMPILALCPSCRLQFRADLPELFPDLADTYGDMPVQDACAFLLSLLDAGLLPMEAGKAEAPENSKKIIYHAPCHLRAQGCGLPGLELLRRIPGLAVENADAGCCGISGSYGFKKEKYAISQRVGARLFARLRESGATVAASDCGTCRLQIESNTGLPCPHPLSELRRFLEKR